MVFNHPVKFGLLNFSNLSFIFILIKLFRTYKRGRLNNTNTFDAGERHDPPDDKRVFNLGLNM